MIFILRTYVQNGNISRLFFYFFHHIDFLGCYGIQEQKIYILGTIYHMILIYGTHV